MYPISVQTSDGKKLFTSTQELNVLITSSFNLHIEEVETGPATHGFTIENSKESQNVQIFMNQTTYEAALIIAKNPECKHMEPFSWI